MGLQVNTCCGCIELRVGCLIIAYVNLIVDIIFMVLMALGVTAGGLIRSQGADDGAKTVGLIMLIVFGLGLALFIILLTFTIVLLVGLHQNKPKHVKVYLVTASILLVLYAIGFLVSLAGVIYIPYLIRDIVYIVAQVYFLIVISSYIGKMNNPSKRPAIYSTA